MTKTRIKEFREAAKLSQEQLADAAGLSVSQISRFESGEREPRVAEMKRISNRLNVPVAILIGENDEPKRLSEVAPTDAPATKHSLRIAEAMRSSRITTATDLARRARANPTTMRAYLSGGRNPPLDVCEAIGQVTGYRGRWLYDGTGPARDDPQFEFKRWLAEKVKPHGMMSRLSEATGIARDKLTRSKELEASDPKKRRQVSLREMKAIAEFFGEVPPGFDWALQGTAATEATPPPSDRASRVQIVGKVKAGEFIAIEDLGDWDGDPRYLQDVRDDRFPNARHLAFEVEGDSMNALKPRPIMHGDVVSALALDDVQDRMPLRDGMIVVVERTRHGGLEREWSIKQLEIYEDRVEFHPRSTNPRYKSIVVPRDSRADDSMTVTIIAIVRRLVAEFI